MALYGPKQYAMTTTIRPIMQQDNMVYPCMVIVWFIVSADAVVHHLGLSNTA